MRQRPISASLYAPRGTTGSLLLSFLPILVVEDTRREGREFVAP